VAIRFFTLAGITLFGLGLWACSDTSTGSSDHKTFSVTVQIDCYVCTGGNFGDSVSGTPYFETTGRVATVQCLEDGLGDRIREIDTQSQVRLRVREGYCSFAVESPHGRRTVFDSIYIDQDTSFTLLVRRYYEHADSLLISFGYTVQPFGIHLSEEQEHEYIHAALEDVGYVFDTVHMEREIYEYIGGRSVVYRSTKTVDRCLWDVSFELAYALFHMAPSGVTLSAAGKGYGLCPEDFKPWPDTVISPPTDTIPIIIWPDTLGDTVIPAPG